MIILKQYFLNMIVVIQRTLLFCLEKIYKVIKTIKQYGRRKYD